MGVTSTDPLALVLDVTIADLAAGWELEHGVGDYWWVSILKALGGSSSGSGTTQTQPPQNVKWF